MRALGLDAPAVGSCLLGLLQPQDRLLDIGTGTGALLELAAPHVDAALGIDASRQMLALARARLTHPGLSALRGAPGRHVSPAAGRWQL